MKKIISLVMCICIIASLATIMSGCGSKNSGEYPVHLGTVTIEKEPMNIVVLSDCMSDIISYIGYDVKMVGRDIESDQDFLKVVPIVGTADNPSIDTIVNYATDLIIADERLSASAKQSLVDQGIPVVTFSKAQSFDELKSIYTTVGMVLGGNITGKAKGESAFDDLVQTLKDFEGTIPSGIIQTACYLYIDENDTLCTITKGTVEAELFAYCGAINIFSNQETPQVDLDQLRISTPTFIFYDDNNVLDYLQNSESLSSIPAMQNNNLYQIKKSDFDRQGTTYEEMIFHMISSMFAKKATDDEATPDESHDM